METSRPHVLGPLGRSLLFAAAGLAVAVGGAPGCGSEAPAGATSGGSLTGTSTGTGTGTGAGGGGGGAVCGDGKVEGDEQCDDGNLDDTDGCTTTCTLVRCGDGVVQGSEQCDDGNFDDGDACVTGCVNATCGDGLVEKGVEECDDGNQVDGDGCSKTCKAESSGCGNGKVDPGEACDDGNASNADDCLTTCVAATCGDGYAHLGVEECDDGNANNDDFCTNDCKLNQPPTFDCPGAAVAVAKGVDTGLTGDTTTSKDGYDGSCGGLGAPDVVYAITPAATGTLTITMQGIGGTDPVLYARKDDCAAGPELGCSDATFGGGKESLTLEVVAGTTYWVFADGYSGTSGAYSLTLHLAGVPGDACPGIAVPIDVGAEVKLDGDTSIAQADLKGTGACSLSGTKDIVYAIKPSGDGTLYVSVDPAAGFDAQLHVRAGTCTKPADQIVCLDDGGPGVSELATFPVVAGTVYYAIVDGKVGQAGAYGLDVYLEAKP
jgi:cysteine-rich repeat protein